MKAVVIRQHGDLDVLRFEDVPDPVAAPDQVVIDVRAVGLNHLDTWVRRGVPGHKFPLPMIPGCDVAGTVSAVGSAVRGLSIGDAVFVAPGFSCGRCRPCLQGEDPLCRDYGIFGETVDGGCAERLAVPAVNALPIPAGLDFVRAAAFPLTFLTAWNMLVRRCALRQGETVLVHAAGSGVGSAAIQIGKLFSATVLATASTEAKRRRALELGADHALDSSGDGWVSTVRELTGRRGVDVVFEHTGEATFPGSLRSLAKGGRVVTCGATSGPRLEADLRLIFFKSLSILGSTMGRRGDLLVLSDLIARGKLAPVVDRVLPLEQVRDAHAALARREQFGKIVLVNGASR